MGDMDETPRITTDGDFLKLTLSFHHRQMLRFIAERGGRVPYVSGRIITDGVPKDAELRAKLARDADASIKQMADKMGLITMTKLIGPTYEPNTFELALTDIGRNIIEQMELMAKQPTLNVDLKTGKEIIK